MILRAVQHTFFMKRETCGGWRAATDGREFFECPVCGNHVCGECAERERFLCPHCFAVLRRAN